MKNKLLFSIAGFVVVLVFVGFIPTKDTPKTDASAHIKVALREIGNQLLLAQGDSTSLVLPVLQEQRNTYVLSFEKALRLEPNDVVVFSETIFAKANLSQPYRVEVLECQSGEVAYSFEQHFAKDQSIIPCMGRTLPKDCFTLKFTFTEETVTTFKQDASLSNNKTSLLYLLLFIAAVPLSVLALKKKPLAAPFITGQQLPLASFIFYPEQYLLVRGDQQISLSKKECELLALFIAAPNQTLPREELSKRVWEDHGVVVGRSLDTYISKLRKKLQADSSLQLTNVHGVGYKLEV